jgi:mRNA interferase MazF
VAVPRTDAVPRLRLEEQDACPASRIPIQSLQETISATPTTISESIRWTLPGVLVAREFGVTSSTIVAEVGSGVPRRGDVWSVEFDQRRRVVLLSAGRGSGFRSVVLVDPARQDISGVAIEVGVGIEEGLPIEEVVRFALPRPGSTPCTWLVDVGREDLIERIGALSEVKMEEIDVALDTAGLDPVTLLPHVA